MEMPDADSAVPQSPVSGNVPSARGLPLAGPGTGSTPRLGGMSLRISFMPSVARAETSPSSTLWTVLLCILAVHIPPPVMVSGASRRHSGRCLNAPRHRLGRLPSPLGGGSLHPDWRPRDMNCGAGSRTQVTEGREGRNVQSVKDS